MRRRRSIAERVLTLVLMVATAPCAGATTATVSPEGNLLLDGTPFFPIGVYHVSWIGDRQGDEAIPDLERAADAGFNLFHPTVDGRDSMGDLFDVAAARGVYVIGEIPWPPNGPDFFVNKWKAKPALIAWNVADDFNAPYTGPTYNHPPSQVAARRDVIHALAPEHLAYASGGSYPGYRIGEFAGTMDVMGFQSYPIGAENHPDDYALQENAESFAWVRDQLAGTGQLFVANPQAYRWAGPHRYPTPREARNMLYASLVYGAKGIVWYTMWEGNGTLLPSVVPGLWDELARLNDETASLTPFLLHGARTELATGHARVHAASWELDGQVLVVALSTQRSVSHAVSLALPAGAVDPAHALFPARGEDGMTVVAGMLGGTIAPESVHVYVLDLPVAGDASPTAAFGVAPATPAFGEAATLDGTTSSDPDGTVVAWTWDFGDGATASGAGAMHTWTTPGVYDVRLTVRDDDGASATVVESVTVGLTSLCPPAPLSGCRVAGQSALKLRDDANPAQRRLDWSWKKAPADLGDLGDPTSATDIALCAWDDAGLTLASGVRAGAGWQSLGAKGFRFKNASGKPGGLVQGTLKPGVNASLQWKGKGASLPTLGLPLTLPVTVQLVTSDAGVCWQAVYAPGSRSSGTATTFKGRQD